MQIFCLIFAVFVFVSAQQQQGSQNSSQPTIQSLSRPSNNNNNQCPRFWRPVTNSQNQDRCIPNEDACRGTSDFQVNSRCNNPCSNFQRNCPRAAICFSDVDDTNGQFATTTVKLNVSPIREVAEMSFEKHSRRYSRLLSSITM
ncbi:hypothetical protein M3Y98_01044500 [Aphelenchoides besseyi]|nr:hypothetical protein M3Y98_01044500 [Aphelenchoides besseyi]